MTQFHHIKLRFFVVTILSVLCVEITGFILVGEKIGVLATLSLTLLTMMIGITLLRIQGVSFLKNIQRDPIQRHTPEYYMADNALIIISAIFLILPGFASDILGILLLIKPVQTVVRSLFLSLKYNKKANARTHPNARNESQKIIELNAEDYQSYDAKKSPWYKSDDND
ncbi:FxsA family protein [Bartonella sp. A05]|uniref:FxsA family protein n=1 Tax=Bartonella sp. A05 TaxID=2967261 RepID=UPI0022A9D1C4|nr:FxsA family protein [Bartonella sp. A05]MCZ2203430.1 FxsA family protein [Bartonella sp. A05]